MLNQRHKPPKTFRRPPQRAAKLSFGKDGSSLNCLVWDISEIGARLGVEQSLVPHHFTLSLFKDCRVQRDCEVVWSDKRFVVVKFTEQRPLEHFQIDRRYPASAR
jgi:hypothetical protein